MANSTIQTAFKAGTIRPISVAMDEYDSLDPEIRKFLQDAPYNLKIKSQLVGRKATPSFMASLRRELANAKVASVKMVYGRNHPDAKIG